MPVLRPVPRNGVPQQAGEPAPEHTAPRDGEQSEAQPHTGTRDETPAVRPAPPAQRSPRREPWPVLQPPRTEPETQRVPQSAPEAETQLLTQPGDVPQPRDGLLPGGGQEARLIPQIGTGVQLLPQAGPEAETELLPQAASEAETELLPQAGPEAGTELVPQAATEPETEPEPVPDPAEQPPPDAEYTPTQRDLPVLGDTSEDRDPTLVDVPQPVSDAEESEGPLFVVGDVHGYLDELRAALREAGLIDAEDHWIAGTARLWFLGDFTDRGPDGIGVIDLVMHLSAEAAAAGGYCKALMGNHELLLLGAKRFGDTPVHSGAGTASFQAAWLLNGGQRTDMDRLEDHHLQWMSRLDAMALADGHLLVHSDATCYLDYGDTIEGVNDALTEALQRNDADETWDLFRKFTKRFAFRDEGAGAGTARELLAAFGGERIVHGHSPIPYLLGQVGSEDENGEETPPDVTGPMVYADGLAIAMDGGVTMAGKLLVTQLPLAE